MFEFHPMVGPVLPAAKRLASRFGAKIVTVHSRGSSAEVQIGPGTVTIITILGSSAPSAWRCVPDETIAAIRAALRGGAP